MIVAADTLVALDGAILGKPADEADAPADAGHVARTLASGVDGRRRAVAGDGPRGRHLGVDRRAHAGLQRRRIAAYVATGDPMDKAAAYAIQHAAFSPVAEIAGCHANVMGLPVCDVHSMLTERRMPRGGFAVPELPRLLGNPLRGPSSGATCAKRGARHDITIWIDGRGS